MCKMVLKAKFYVTGSLDTAPWGPGMAPCSGASDKNLRKGTEAWARGRVQ